ncbi:hypothetical protein TVAG_295630 [Trichomonas vaginalis G3]|uniref:Leucine Rich Repeat family protein n=1 Tax=Trichomonas vaginalis (strain ATCC PRA-98 / G3) TaxID=412133 RepID=A2F230_TRIV3|nr:leucine-rich repeat, isoform f-related family [Trichomonas vaginalis G3]EAY01029.1 hypothetical protein TVAG_295630 [Trichomonas vaginalis G3]KAI5488624.1 leucine-rich repeat, isoform f-related family [Trichomonas vaginalis G3]|eukprot:XP_001313915.1 hypothetical protein [Trichomonas vaginalis G3]
MKPFNNYLLSEKKQPIHCETITLPGLIKKRRVMALSNWGISLFKAKQPKIVEQHKWFDISQYEMNSTTNKLVFKDSILTFDVENGSELPNKIKSVLEKLMTQSEITGINKEFHSIPTQRSAFARIVALNPEKIKELNYFLRTTPDSIKITNENSKYIFNLIPLLPEVTSLEVELNESSQFMPKFLNFIKYDSQLKHIHFIGPLPNQYSVIAEALVSNMHSRLQCLSFTDSNLSQEQFLTLISILNSRNIYSLSFHNASPNSYYFFYNTVVPKIRIAPKFINMRSTSGILLQNLLTSRTIMLSLDNCNLEVSTIFEILSSNINNFKNLRVLSVSNNLCTKTFGENLVLPKLIHTIFANGVRWSGFHMKAFFEILFANFNGGLSLSLAQTNANTGEWKSIDDFLSFSQFKSLQVLDWSGNPISRPFISFLSRQKFLQTLIFNDCFTLNRPAEVKLFANYLEGSPIKRLVMNGTEATHLGDNLSLILNSLKKCQNIREISIEKHYAQNTFYNALKEFAKSTTKRCLISFDESSPVSYAELLDFLNFFLNDPNISTVICFPQNDISKYMGVETEYRDVNQLLDKFAMRYAFSKEYETVFDKPFKIPWFAYKFEFPEYITEEQLSSIVKQRGIPAELLQNNSLNVTPLVRGAGEPITTPIWSGTSKPKEIEGGRRHRHRTPMTIDNETPKRNSPNVIIQKEPRRRHRRHANTLQGEDIPENNEIKDRSPKNNEQKPNIEENNHHHHRNRRNPTPQPHTTHKKEDNIMKSPEIAQKIEPLRSSRRRSQSAKHQHKSPLCIEATNNLEIADDKNRFAKTEIKAVSLLKLNNSPPILEISPIREMEKPLVTNSHKHHHHAKTLAGDEDTSPATLQPDRQRRRRSVGKTIDGSDNKIEQKKTPSPKKIEENEDKEPQTLQPERKRRRRKVSVELQNFILKEEPKSKKAESSEEEPLFVPPIYLQNDEKPPEKLRRVRKHRKPLQNEDDAKWNMPTLPVYPVNDNIWDALSDNFILDQMIAEIKATPIDLHYHHMPDDPIKDSDN